MSNVKKLMVEEKPKTTERIIVAPEPEATNLTHRDLNIQDEPHAKLIPIPDWSKIGRMDPDSLAARWLLEKRSVIRELHQAYVHQVIFYTKPEGGGLSIEEAIKLASGAINGQFDAKELYDSLATQPPSAITWYQIDKLFKYDPAIAQAIWEDIKEAADADFRSGHRAAEVFERTEWQHDPWKRARFMAVRDSFVEQFKPQGGIDHSMIDMLAVTFSLWMHWAEIHIHRSTTEMTAQLSKSEREYAAKYKGEWMPPRVSEREAIEQAAQMADRWRRAYQATLRQMRDWRRYSVPVTINNPQQVNIAANGGQQVNVQDPIEKGQNKHDP